MFDQMVSQLATVDKTIKPGDVFGRLTVTGNMTRNKWGGRMQHCVCSCGNDIVTREYMLLAGESKSCGCLRRELAINNLPAARERLAQCRASAAK